jgi:hypothetical protein
MFFFVASMLSSSVGQRSDVREKCTFDTVHDVRALYKMPIVSKLRSSHWDVIVVRNYSCE